jgi:hypothetical protein
MRSGEDSSRIRLLHAPALRQRLDEAHLPLGRPAIGAGTKLRGGEGGGRRVVVFISGQRRHLQGAAASAGFGA